MATRSTRPGRVLVLFLLGVVVLYVLAAFSGSWKPTLGLDLQGGTRIALEAKASSGEVTSDKLDEARDIIDQRVNGAGVSEAEVTTQGSNQVVVEIPGQEQQDIVDEVGRTAQLRFRLVWGTGIASGTGSTTGPTGPDASPSTQPPQQGDGGNSGGNGGGNGDGNGTDQNGTNQNGTDGTGSDGGDTPSGQGTDGASPSTDGQTPGADASNSSYAIPTRGSAATAVTPVADGTPTTDPPSPQPSPTPTDTPSGDAPTDTPSGDAPTDTPTGGAGTDPVAEADWSALSLDQMITAETQGLQSLPKDYQLAVSALQTELAQYPCTAESQAATDDVADQPLISCDPTSGETFILSPAVIEGTQLDDAAATLSQSGLGWQVNLQLDGGGTDTFSTVTDALYQQEVAGNEDASRFAIVLDGSVISAPTSNAHIVDGNSQISGGGLDQEGSQSLANSLKYGSLPLTFGVNSVSVEGPSLAGSQLDAGIVAGLIGLALVVLYGLAYYRGLGLVMVASLAVSGAITYALVLLLATTVGFTLTLPGIAGLIVAIGITADSFIVFFERLRDEVRDGRSLRLAVENGWRRARTTILAADAVSFLAALVLYIFAIGVVRGFAFALGLTTLIDIAVVFLFTKPLMSLLARTEFFGRGHKWSGLDARHLGVSGRSITTTVDRARPVPAARTTRSNDGSVL